MTIKYGELTIIHNGDMNVFNSFSLWLGYELYVTESSKMIFLFEDGETCSDENLVDYQFKFTKVALQHLPLYFEKSEKKNGPVYFYVKPTEINSLQRLDFKPLFQQYSKFLHSTTQPSMFNNIYYCFKTTKKVEIFGLVRIQSNEHMPRFQFAYDSDEFTKEEIMYFIKYILS